MKKKNILLACLAGCLFSAANAMEQAQYITITKELNEFEKSSTTPTQPKSLTLPLKAIEGSALLRATKYGIENVVSEDFFNQTEQLAIYLQQTESAHTIIRNRAIEQIIKDFEIADFLGFKMIADAIIDYLANLLTTPIQLNQFIKTPQLIQQLDERLASANMYALCVKLRKKLSVLPINITITPSLTITPHKKADVTYACYNHDGSQFLTTSATGEIKVWDSETKKEIFLYKAHTDEINMAVFNPIAPNIIASASDDHTVVLWDIQTNKSVARINHQFKVTTVFFSEDGKKIITAAGLNVTICDSTTGATIQTIPFSDKVVFAAFCNDPNMLLFLCDGTTSLYTINNPSEKIINSTSLPGKTLAINANDNVIAIPSSFGHISVYDITHDSSAVKKINLPGEVNCLQFNPDNDKQLLVGSSSIYPAVYSLSTYSPIYTFVGHKEPILSAFFKPSNAPSPESKNKNAPLEVITASYDGTVKFWTIFDLSKLLKNSNLGEILFVSHLLLNVKLNEGYTINLQLPEYRHLKNYYLDLPREAKMALNEYIPFESIVREAPAQENEKCIIS